MPTPPLALHMNSTERDKTSVLVVASLGWVIPGAATEGVAPIFFPEKPAWRPFFSRQFCGVIAFYCFYSGVTPSRVSPTPFLPVQPRFSTILCKFANKKISFGCYPLEGVTRGGPPAPSDATVCEVVEQNL